jgi:hypothetical protein
MITPIRMTSCAFAEGAKQAIPQIATSSVAIRRWNKVILVRAIKPASQVYFVDRQVSLNQPGGKNEWFLAIHENCSLTAIAGLRMDRNGIETERLA